MKGAGRLGGDAVHLEDGCTGRIGLLTVTQSVADGVKVAEGAHDLTIGGGTIRCLGKTPNVHQDGIQVMGGARIRFENLTVRCGRPGESLINSNLFINQTGRSTAPPTTSSASTATSAAAPRTRSASRTRFARARSAPPSARRSIRS